MTDERRVTIADIAEELGLSTATVSNVIHGKTHKVSDETVRRVQALLEERQYIPNMAGILLARNSSGIIGVAVNRHEKYEGRALEDPFIASSLNHLSLEIERARKFMMVKTTTEISEIITFASMWNMEGLILIGFCQQDFTWLRQHMRIPFVAYDADSPATERITMLNLDNFDGGFQVGQLFRRLGHRKVLCISDNDTFLDHDRYEGLRAGFGSGAELLLIPMRKEERAVFYADHLARLRQYTAVFAVSDYYAMDLMGFLSGHGIRVPADISVAGFDGTPAGGQVFPTLTTVQQDGPLRARTALEQLTRLRAGAPGTTIILPVTLLERESTGSCREG